MSLDVYLTIEKTIVKKGTGVFVRKNGQNVELTMEEVRDAFPNKDISHISEVETETNEVFSANITHNLGDMAMAVGIYEHLWRPEEIDIKKANQLIDPLRETLHKLKINPDEYKKYNPNNGWGSYDTLVTFISKYLDACYEYPESDVVVWR